MSSFDTIDFFTDPSLVPDPHPYFDYLRSQNPVMRLPHHGVVAVTGYEEASEVYKDPDTFSNIVSPLRASARAMSWGVVTMMAPATGTRCERVS